MSNFFIVDENVFNRVKSSILEYCLRCNLESLRPEWDHPEDFDDRYFFVALGRTWSWPHAIEGYLFVNSFQPMFKTREEARCASKTFPLPCKVVKLETPVTGTHGPVEGESFKWALSPKSIKVGVI